MRSCTVIAGRLSWRNTGHITGSVSLNQSLPQAVHENYAHLPVEQRNKTQIKGSSRKCNMYQIINMFSFASANLSNDNGAWHTASACTRESMYFQSIHPQLETNFSHQSLSQTNLSDCKICDPSPFKLFKGPMPQGGIYLKS